MSQSIYMDYAAATPVDERVVSAMLPYLSENFYNPSATYMAAQAVRKDLQAAREKVAAVLGARPTEVVFTAGGTEADNLAVDGIMQKYPRANLVVSAIEHEAILQAAYKYSSKLANVDAKGMIDVADLQAKIDDQTVLVSVMYVNNEVGTVQPLRKIARIVQEVRSQRRRAGNSLPLYFHTDASQAPNYLDVHVSRLGIDLMTLNGGKIYGPKQTGMLFVAAGVVLEPQVRGGGQERGLRSGTENIPGIIGFATALEVAQQMRSAEVERLQKLQALFVVELKHQMPRAVVNASTRNRLPNNVHISIPGVDNERLVMQLDELGVMCAVGSACSASSEEPSHVLTAMGMSSADVQSSVRFTMGRATTKQDIMTTVTSLLKCLR